jgi:hypothetical protein
MAGRQVLPCTAYSLLTTFPPGSGMRHGTSFAVQRVVLGANFLVSLPSSEIGDLTVWISTSVKKAKSTSAVVGRQSSPASPNIHGVGATCEQVCCGDGASRSSFAAPHLSSFALPSSNGPWPPRKIVPWLAAVRIEFYANALLFTILHISTCKHRKRHRRQDHSTACTQCLSDVVWSDKCKIKVKVTATQRHCLESPVVDRWRPI